MNPGIVEQIEQWQGAMTVEDLALILKCSKKTLYKRTKKRKLPTIKIGSLIRLCPQTVAAWAAGTQCLGKTRLRVSYMASSPLSG